jgi:hypothetical protein
MQVLCSIDHLDGQCQKLSVALWSVVLQVLSPLFGPTRDIPNQAAALLAPQGVSIAHSVSRRDGKDLYFMGTDAGVPKMMGVPVTPEGASLRRSKPPQLFDARVPEKY